MKFLGLNDDGIRVDLVFCNDEGVVCPVTFHSLGDRFQEVLTVVQYWDMVCELENRNKIRGLYNALQSSGNGGGV